jgi:quinol-cytochrome oxidoreductase complex cytochrome b subunit
MTPGQQFAGWLRQRLGGPLFGGFLNRNVPDETGLPHTLGSATLFLLVLQVVTGIVLALNYSPTPEHAYDSVTYIMTQVLFGPVVRGLHHWGANALVIVVGLHMLRVVVWGSYRAPREITWMAGVGLLLLIMGFAFTGYLLPWTQRSYWATVVGTKVIGTVPLIGDWLLRVVRGEAEVGVVTLARFYAVHTLVLPALLVPLVTLHLYLVYRHGMAPASGDEGPVRKTKRFYPDQLAEDAAVSFVVLLILFGLTALWGVPTEVRADPASTTYVPRPEWYFLFLFQLLKYFQGPIWEPVGVVALPVVVILVLFALPFLDRAPARRRRPYALAGAGVGIATLALLTYLGAVQLPPGSQVAPAGSSQALVDQGHEVFVANKCLSCHVVKGEGVAFGPELTHLASRSFSADKVKALIRNPLAVNPQAGMPAFDKLSDSDLQALVAYLSTLK